MCDSAKREIAPLSRTLLPIDFLLDHEGITIHLDPIYVVNGFVRTSVGNNYVTYDTLVVRYVYQRLSQCRVSCVTLLFG